MPHRRRGALPGPGLPKENLLARRQEVPCCPWSPDPQGPGLPPWGPQYGGRMPREGRPRRGSPAHAPHPKEGIQQSSSMTLLLNLVEKNMQKIP